MLKKSDPIVLISLLESATILLRTDFTLYERTDAMSKSKRNKNTSHSKKRQSLGESLDITLKLGTKDRQKAEELKVKHDKGYTDQGWRIQRSTIHPDVKGYLLKIRGERIQSMFTAKGASCE